MASRIPRPKRVRPTVRPRAKASKTRKCGGTLEVRSGDLAAALVAVFAAWQKAATKVLAGPEVRCQSLDGSAGEVAAM